MLLLRKAFRALFLSCLLVSLAGCSHGPKVNVCVSNTQEFICSNKVSGKAETIAFDASAGMYVYPPQSEQALLDYCAARTQSGTAAPQFAQCVSEPTQGGFLCQEEECQLNGTQNGALCSPTGSEFVVTYESSNDYIALSPADNTTILAYCNVTLQ